MKYPFISKVEIKNFRNFKELSLDLEPSCVLVGENGTGKSNFLEALRMVLDPSLADSFRHLQAEDFWDGLDHPFGGTIIQIGVYIQGFEDSEGAKSILADCTISSKPFTALLTYQFRPQKGIKDTSVGNEDYEFVVFGGADEKNRVGTTVRQWIALTVLPALRDAPADMQNWRKSPLRRLLDRAGKLIEADTLSNIRLSLDSAILELINQPAIKTIASDINDRVNRLVGPVHSVETQFDFASSEPDQLLRSLRLFLKEKQTRPMSEASLGTTNIVFLALLLQNLELQQQEQEIVSTILAIEEPEAHLHPHLQRLLFRYFASQGRAVLVTTHSPNIASVTPLRSLVLFKKTKDGSKAFTPRQIDFSSSEIEDLQRYLDVTRAEILFSKGVIFVEGVAEQFLIPAFASSLLGQSQKAKSLDELGVSVCSVNGTDFAPFRRLLSSEGLSIPNLVVTDGDQLDSTEGPGFPGLERGAGLIVDDAIRTSIEQLIAEENYDEARSKLSSEGIFVGEKTLEIDILSALSNEMVESYTELIGSKTSSRNFSKLAKAATQRDPDSISRLLDRIERVGKGRFAQRLAAKVTTQTPPAYIKSAIDRITKLVASDSA